MDNEAIINTLEADVPRVFSALRDRIHVQAIKSGFWERDGYIQNAFDPDIAAGKIALMHSELSEALEDIRRGLTNDEHCQGFANLDIELADCVIRILDFCGARGIDLGAAIVAKMAYNGTRPLRHGKTI
jgi:NTP pyrophosphatase (non-canonical NTP hydrolase)